MVHATKGQRVAPWGLLVLAALMLLAMFLLSGCDYSRAIGRREEFNVALVDDQTNDAEKLLERETDRLLWDIEYRLRTSSATHKKRAAAIEAAFAAELAAITDGDIQARTVEATNAYRDERDAEAAGYNATVQGHLTWAEGEAATIWSEHQDRLARAQGIAEIGAAIDREHRARVDVLEGMKASGSLQTIIDTIHTLAAQYLPEGSK